MKSHCNIAVIGGGILGCSVLYYLAKRGVNDLVLIEKDELTSGTTWHSVGNIFRVDESLQIARINALSCDLYKGLETDTGHPIGLHMNGNVRVASNKHTLERYEHIAAAMSKIGSRSEIIGPKDIIAKFPFVNLDGLLGAMWTPEEGNVDPSMTTQAFAKGARSRGAEIYRHTRVQSLQNVRGKWRIDTDKGSMTADNVILAAGMWTPELAKPLGLNFPIVPLERQYLITEDVPELADLGFELPVLRDYDIPVYFRQERQGLLMGIQEPHPAFCFPDGIPKSFAGELLPPDLERSMTEIEASVARVPIMGRLGTKTVVCGPTGTTPDFNGLIGPVPRHPGLFALASVTAGISQGPAVGYLLAEWIVQGKPSLDLSLFDVSRFGPSTSKYYVRKILGKVHGYGLNHAEPDPTIARPLRTSPLYFRHKNDGAAFIERLGWECPAWFKTAQAPTSAVAVAAESEAARKGVGILDLSSLTKYEITGPGATGFLSKICKGKIPDADGKVGEVELNARSGSVGRFLIGRLNGDRFYMIAAPESEFLHLATLESNAPSDGSVTIINMTTQYGALLLVGPDASDLLSRISTENIDLADGEIRDVEIGYSQARLMKRDMSGLPAWQVHVRSEYLVGLENVMRQANGHAPADIGFMAFDALRAGSNNEAFTAQGAVRPFMEVL